MSMRLAIVANEQTPYRLHLHRRIVRELPEVELWSVFTHEVASSPWNFRDEKGIRPVLFGRGEHSGAAACPLRAWHEWKKGGRITQWLLEQGVQAVIVNGYNDLGRLRILRWCHQRGLPCYLFGDSNILGDGARGWKRMLKRAYLESVLRRCAGVMYCGRLGRAYFEAYGARTEQLYVFPYEPDYEMVARQGENEIRLAQQEFRLGHCRRRLLFAGRMVESKRPDLLLDAFSRIREERPDWDLVMVGDGPLRRNLEARGVAHVHWTGFVGEQEQLARLYAACDVFVLPSDYEPWGVVLTEAATRLALVASDRVGAAAEVIEEGRNGFLFPAGSVEGLTLALKKATAPGFSEAAGRAGAKVIQSWRAESDPVASLRRVLGLQVCGSTGGGT